MENRLFSNIPDELRAIPQWVCWRWEDRNGKPSKVPKNPRTGGNAGSTYPDTWGSFEAAVQACERFGFDGIGWVFREGSGYFGVDLDHCIDNAEMCNEFVETLQSYNEISTSGTGLHIICKGVLPSGKKRHNNVEMYSQGRYFIFTGNVYNGRFRQVVDCTEAIKPLHEKYLPQKKQEQKPQAMHNPVNIEDEELLNLAKNSKNGMFFEMLYAGAWHAIANYQTRDKSGHVHADQSKADMALCCMLAFWTGCEAARMDRLFRGSGLMRKKWDERRGVLTYGQRTIKAAIENCNEVYSPATGALD